MGGKRMEEGDNTATWYHLNLDMFPQMCTHAPYRHPHRTLTHTHAPTLRIQIQGKKGKSGEGGIQVAEGESSGGGSARGGGGRVMRATLAHRVGRALLRATETRSRSQAPFGWATTVLPMVRGRGAAAEAVGMAVAAAAAAEAGVTCRV